jgi:hypothetical protein
MQVMPKQLFTVTEVNGWWKFIPLTNVLAADTIQLPTGSIPYISACHSMVS